MTKEILILGVAVIDISAAVPGYDHYSYTMKAKLLQVGPITATADRSHTALLPPIISWLLAGGANVIAFGALSKKN